MSNPSADKGARAERAFLAHIAPWWPNARRGKAGAEADLGDIFGVVDRDGDPWTIQVADRKWRNHGELLAKAREAAEQAERAGTGGVWCMVVKRPGCTDVGDWFVWMPVWCAFDTADGMTVHILGAGGAMWELNAVNDLCMVTVRTWLAMYAPRRRP